MKKFYVLVVSISMLLILCSCNSGSGESSPTKPSAEEQTTEVVKVAEPEVTYTIDDMIGKWVSEEKEQVIIVKSNAAEVFIDGLLQYTDNFISPENIVGDQFEIPYITSFTITSDGDTMQLICNATNVVEKGTVFTKTADIYSDEEILGNWDGVNNDGVINFDPVSKLFGIENQNGGTSYLPTGYLIVGDMLFLGDDGVFKIEEKDGKLYLDNGQLRFVKKDD